MYCCISTFSPSESTAWRVDFLLQHAQLVADAHDFVEEDLERDLLGLQRRVGRVEDGLALVPTAGQF